MEIRNGKLYKSDTMLDEKKWLLVYSELLTDAMRHFYLNLIQKENLLPLMVENFEKTTDDIDYEHIKGSIELLLLEVERNKLYEFLNRIFIKPNTEVFKILEEATLNTQDEFERSDDLNKKRIVLSARLYSMTDKIYQHINELNSDEKTQSVSSEFSNSKELEIIKEQFQYVYSSFKYFEMLEKQKDAINYEGIDQYISTLDNIDIGKINLNIAALQIEYNQQKIYSFLKNSININSKQIKRLKKVSDEMTLKRETSYPELDPRIKIAGRLYKIYTEIIAIIEEFKPDDINELKEHNLGVIHSPIEEEDSELTVKGIIMAYLYMYRKNIYPIPEIYQDGKKMIFYKKLSEKYALSKRSFIADWRKLENKENRKSYPPNIKIAINILKKINHPDINEAIKLAKEELREAELKM